MSAAPPVAFLRYDKTTGAIIGWGQMAQSFIDDELAAQVGIVASTADPSASMVDLSTLTVVPKPAPAPPTLDQTKASRKSQIAARRYKAEIAGVQYDGHSIATDLESQSKILAVCVQAQTNSALTVQWKCATGDFVPFSASQILAMGAAVFAYVQACFANEEALDAAVGACADAASVAAVNMETGWP